MKIPGTLVKGDCKKPVTQYKIDRLTLAAAGISSDLTDRIYRALFVYSIGFHELIEKCMEHTK